MTGLVLWQRVVYYLGMALMVGGLAWGLYRMATIHGCPVARFNDLSLIALGLGVAIAPLHPFTPAPTYLAPALRRSRNLAGVVWALALAGAAVAVYALWIHMPSLVWFAAMIPAAYYMWFGIEVGRPAERGGRASLPASSLVGPTAVSAINDSPVGRTAVSAINPDAGKMPALPGESRTEPSAPRGEEESRLEASAPREDSGQRRPPSGDEEPRDA